MAAGLRVDRSCVRRGGLVVVLSAASLCSACSAGLKLTRLEAVARTPSNVAVLFAIDDSENRPVANLLAHDFNIYEDDKLVSVAESRQTMINPAIIAAHYTLLLVDMTAGVTASEQLAGVVKAASQFLRQVEGYQRVAVYAFDGGKNLYEIMPFTPSGPLPAQALSALASFQSRDPSTNLNGAILLSLSELDKVLERSTAPLRFGTLVVFTDGADRANRVPFQQMVDAVEASDNNVYALGIGHEIDDSTLARVGKSGYVRVEDGSASESAFHEIGARIVDYTRRYYLLSYCSPARAGRHTVSIEATVRGGKGRLDYAFDADNFAPGCDPTRPPSFDTQH